MSDRNHKNSFTLLNLSILSCLFFLYCPAMRCLATEFNAKSFPVPVNVEGERTPSSLFLKFEVKYYDTSLDKFGSLISDDRERVFFQIAEGIRKRDYARVEQLLQLPAKENLRSNTVVSVDRDIKKTVDLYWSAFGGFQDIKVVCQVLIGSRNLFVWQANTGKVQLLRAFAVLSDRNNKTIATEVTMNTPLDLLILNTLEYSVKQAESYKPVQDLKKEYEYPFPVDGPGNTGPHPVYLQFNGQRLDFEVFDENESAPNDILRFYRNAFTSLKRKVIEEFLNFHTPKSQAKLRAWYASMPNGEFDAYLSRTTKVRNVKFLINADPIYFVFYSVDALKEWKPGTLNYQYVVKEKISGQFRIANVLYESFLDDVLKNSELFDQSYFKKKVAMVNSDR